ncbi:MAG TPA: glycosyltransferase family 2 protein [Fibrobacteria bacterium]|nr:glycosyltransferase family 2 protein [Fibrobacteria bacterium]
MTDGDWKAEDPDGAGAPPLLSIILPCYNEEKNIEPVHRALAAACAGIRTEMIFVDDGSSDRTGEEVDRLAARDPGVRLLRFIGNAGHQNALRAGYRAARGRWIATMDADLQHPAEAVPAMLAKAREGFDVVQMVRSGSQAGFFKDLSSRAFYKVFNSLSEVPIPEHASDFRLVSRYACDVLNSLPERNLIVRAILPYLGFRTASLPFQVADRLHGRAGFSFRKSLDMGSQALFNFSAVPLKLAMRVGLLISALAFLYGLYNVAAKFLSHRNVPGYTDLIASTLFLGGLILVYLGILGRYILVILDHLKRRPEYLLAEEAPRAQSGPSKGDIRARPEGRRA